MMVASRSYQNTPPSKVASNIARTSHSRGAALQFSLFLHARSNEPLPVANTWRDVTREMSVNYVPTPGNPGGDAKRSMPALCGASFRPGTTRGFANVSGVALLILDFDNSAEEVIPAELHPSGRPKTRKVRIGTPVTMTEVMAHLKLAGIASYAWTTWSCSPEHEKFRVVIPLAYPVPAPQWARASEWALEHLGLNRFRRGIDVPVLHNPAALAFFPGSPNPSTIRRAETVGNYLSIPLVDLPVLPPPTLAPWQIKVVAARKAQSQAGEKWWKHYRINGSEIDFTRLSLPGVLASRGIDVGPERPFKDGTKHRAHCPWASEHTDGVDDDSVVVIKTPGCWPSFKCAHSGHAHLGLRDLIEWAWGKP